MRRPGYHNATQLSSSIRFARRPSGWWLAGVLFTVGVIVSEALNLLRKNRD